MRCYGDIKFALPAAGRLSIFRVVVLYFLLPDCCSIFVLSYWLAHFKSDELRFMWNSCTLDACTLLVNLVEGTL